MSDSQKLALGLGLGLGLGIPLLLLLGWLVYRYACSGPGQQVTDPLECSG